jgi:hypothetical protein
MIETKKERNFIKPQFPDSIRRNKSKILKIIGTKTIT